MFNIFQQFGEIIECRVLKDRNLKSNKGVAFVQFSLRIQANNGQLILATCTRSSILSLELLIYNLYELEV